MNAEETRFEAWLQGGYNQKMTFSQYQAAIKISNDKRTADEIISDIVKITDNVIFERGDDNGTGSI